MYTDKANLEGKAGVIELGQVGVRFVIANRRLFTSGRASKFAVVDTQRTGVDEVFPSQREAVSSLKEA